ncbi:MAG TPA: hypothetical protein VGX23_21185 [Actinocrinis sp.]|nr:hypothetical protein [Actinocrinis sp.]
MSIFSIRTHTPGPLAGPGTGAFRPRPAATARPAAARQQAQAPERAERFHQTLRRERRERKRDSVFWLLFGVVGASASVAMIVATAWHFIQPILSIVDGN